MPGDGFSFSLLRTRRRSAHARFQNPPRADRSAGGRSGFLPGGGPGETTLALCAALPATVFLRRDRAGRPVADADGPPGRAQPRSPPVVLVGPSIRGRRQFLGGAWRQPADPP